MGVIVIMAVLGYEITDHLNRESNTNTANANINSAVKSTCGVGSFALDYPVQELISDYADEAMKTGTYSAKGYVVGQSACPPCSGGAMCMPCPPDSIVVNTDYPMESGINMETDNPGLYPAGNYYLFTFSIEAPDSLPVLIKAEETPVISNTATDSLTSQTDDGNIAYTNNVWNFSFEFPDDWTVLRDTLADKSSTDYANQTGALFVGVPEDENGRSVPSVNLWITPDGFGPFFPNETWTIEKTGGHGFRVTKKIVHADDGNQNSEYYQIIASESSLDAPNRFYIHYTALSTTSATWPSFVEDSLVAFNFSGMADQALLKAALAEKNNVATGSLTLNLTHETDSHVRGGVIFDQSETDSEEIFYAALKNDSWEVIAQGGSNVLCDLLILNDFPPDMREGCVPPSPES